MLPSRTISITVDRPWTELYEAFWRPESFPLWASGLATANLQFTEDRWVAQGPEGPITIRFSPQNEFGVMDHWVHLADGLVVYMPTRMIANGEGAEVIITLYRQPIMSDADFERDANWVRKDLETLKRLAESDAS